MYMILEQRKYVRIKKTYITRYKVIPNDNKITKDWDGVAVVNLSAGGIFIYSRTNLKIGQITLYKGNLRIEGMMLFKNKSE